MANVHAIIKAVLSTIDLQTIRDNLVDLGATPSIVMSLINDRTVLMMGKRIRAACAAGALMMAGCVSMGTDYDPAAVELLQPGMDKAEVIARLGRPSSVAAMPDGKQQLMWMHSKGNALGRASARTVSLMFGADGKYIGLVSQAETTLR